MRVWQSTSCFVACVFLAAIAGCGSSPESPKVAPATLGGNWSLFGPLPNTTFDPGLNTVSGIALTIQQADKELAAVYSAQYTCSGIPHVQIFSFALTGTIGDDGTFVLAESASTGSQGYPVLEITGTAPAASGAGWAGTYNFLANPTVCSQPFKGSFTATQIQPLTGTYSGNFAIPGSTAPATVVATLTQGVTVPATAQAPAFYNASAITGMVTVSGVSCLSSGVLSDDPSVPFPTLIGNAVELNFAMNDGSSLQALGYEEDLTANTLEMEFITDLSGNCQFQTVTPFVLSKQVD